MTWRIIDAPVGTLACDCYSTPSAAQAQSLYADGYRAIGQYAHLVTARSVEECTAAGLGVFFILEGLAAASIPTTVLGQRIAEDGRQHLRALGVPQGVTIAGDLEGEQRLPADWIDFGNTECAIIKAGGDLPLGYYGEGLGLTSAEIQSMAWPRYWKSGSRVKDRFGYFAEPSRGWCVVQGSPFDIARPDGLEIDVDVLWHDYHGNGITLLVEA